MKKNYLIYCLFCFLIDSTCFGKGTWTQKANLVGGGREYAAGFAIGNKGYIGAGTGYNDFWEYDPATNTWTQKANFAGGTRLGPTGFSIGNKGYIGTGYYKNNALVTFYYKDFWEFDPNTNIWTQKADFA